METALRPYAIHRDEGETLAFFGALTWIKASGAQTGGAFGLIGQVLFIIGDVLLCDRGRGFMCPFPHCAPSAHDAAHLLCGRAPSSTRRRVRCIDR